MSVWRSKVFGHGTCRMVAVLLAAVMTVATVLLAAGCGNSQTAQQAAGPKKIRVGYSGTACEAFIYAAQENGYFKDEGLDVELVKVNFDTAKEALSTGKMEAANTMVMKWAKPFEQGTDVTFTAGIHTGCIQLLVPKNSDIKTVADLKGKVIGNNAMGDGPMVFAMRALAKAGLDPKNDVQWRAYPATELVGALERGEVAAIVLSDPIAQMSIENGQTRKLLSTAQDAPYKDEYCCVTALSGKLVRDDPATAAAVTRASMKGARWVAAHKEEAARMMVEKGYVPGDPALIAKMLNNYNYIPSVDGGEKAVDLAISEMQAIGVLDPSTDIVALKKRAFTRLPGVE